MVGKTSKELLILFFSMTVCKSCSGCSTRSSHQRCSIKNVFLKISQISQENTCDRASFLIKLQAYNNLIKKESLTQVSSCEICEIFKKTFFIEHLRTTASIVPWDEYDRKRKIASNNNSIPGKYCKTLKQKGMKKSKNLKNWRQSTI